MKVFFNQIKGQNQTFGDSVLPTATEINAYQPIFNRTKNMQQPFHKLTNSQKQ